jgi:hypothetical protein
MSTPYEDQLKAIREMLAASSGEVVREGYYLLFDLWLENMDASEFQQDLVLIAVEEPDLIKEFEHQINDLVIREGITDVYLRVRLKKLATDVVERKESMKKLFISYSHKDEVFKDELVTMLAGLQRQGIIDPWQDRRIEVGTEWFDAICQAMEVCNIAVLLISSDFIASPFIQNKELTRLFQRRLKEGLRVIPIIVRPCLWQQEPVIKDLQVVPRDGKAVISFSKENGDRDQVWAEIGNILRNLSL